jgi:hypothetical protein
MLLVGAPAAIAQKSFRPFNLAHPRPRRARQFAHHPAKFGGFFRAAAMLEPAVSSTARSTAARTMHPANVPA